eukprot:GCRY01003474.1.p1 GENE.GCRY01003474.1~~GCRY01003474.1.p1  ORF type:complete len:422 (+),score=29.65 GCRY01003474.1:69-1334(+)
MIRTLKQAFSLFEDHIALPLANIKEPSDLFAPLGKLFFLLLWCSLLLVAVLVLSLILAILLYNNLVPLVMFEEPVFFDYSAHNPNATLCFLSFNSSQNDCVNNFSSQNLKNYVFLTESQQYDFGLKLVLPDTVKNRESEMSWVKFQFFSTDEVLIYQTTRSFMHPYTPLFFRYLYYLICAPFYLIGWCHFDKTLFLPVAFSMLSAENTRLGTVKMTLSSQSLHLKEATLVAEAHLSLFQKLYAGFPLSSIAVTTVILFFGLGFVAFVYFFLTQFTSFKTEIFQFSIEPPASFSPQLGQIPENTDHSHPPNSDPVEGERNDLNTPPFSEQIKTEKHVDLTDFSERIELGGGSQQAEETSETEPQVEEAHQLWNRNKEVCLSALNHHEDENDTLVRKRIIPSSDIKKEDSNSEFSPELLDINP